MGSVTSKATLRVSDIEASEDTGEGGASRLTDKAGCGGDLEE